MPSIAAIRRRHSARMRRAVHNNLRNRRDSHRGFPDLHGTHLIPLFGSLPIASFPNTRRDTTFKFRIDLFNSVANGPVVTFGDQGYVGFINGDLAIVTGGPTASTFTAPFIGAPKSEAEVVVALRPQIGEVRVWVDSVLHIANEVENWPYDWGTSGDVLYVPTGAALPTDESILCRAARWGNYATSKYIFLFLDSTSVAGGRAIKPYLSIYDGSVPWHCDRAVTPW